MGKFSDKVVLVTGGATGIGRASALLFAKEGGKVVVADLNEEAGLETVSQIQNSGGEASFIKTDVSKSKEVQALIEKTIERYGRLDAAHNNAGINGKRLRCAEYEEEDWDEVIQINLKSVWLCMKFEILAMQQAGGGAIVNTASIGGLVGIKRSAPYVAAKHGIVGLTKTAALEYVRENIRINAVCPGMIDTPLLERAIIGKPAENPVEDLVNKVKKNFIYKSLEGQQPSGRMGTAEEVAQAVLWLSSADASFVTGHALVIDGAYTAR